MKQITQLIVRCAFGVCVLFLLQQQKATAQVAMIDSQKKVEALGIGDDVPNLAFENVLNYKSKKAKLSDFKGKLVILDMWSTWCTSCIAAFPKMEKLQNEFKDRIQILLVNPHTTKYDSEEQIKLTLGRNQKRTGFYPSLPVPIHDSILNSYFPHQTVPHQVWISGEGKVVAITRSAGVTEENVKAYLEGKMLKMPVKNDWAFDKKKPLLVDGNGGESKDFIFRSMFTGYRDEIGSPGGFRVNANNEVVGAYILNNSLRGLVYGAYSEFSFNPNKTFFDVNNPSLYRQDTNPSNLYCYDLVIPPVPMATFDQNKYLREDLKRFFGISVRKEKRKIKCLVLTASEQLAKAYTKYDKPDMDMDESTVDRYIKDYSISEVIQFLDVLDKPMIDNTKINKNIDLFFPKKMDLTNETALIQFLQKVGFEIKEEEREMDVVVITDKR